MLHQHQHQRRYVQTVDFTTDRSILPPARLPSCPTTTAHARTHGTTALISTAYTTVYREQDTDRDDQYDGDVSMLQDVDLDQIGQTTPPGMNARH